MEAITKAVEILGGPAAASRALGVTPQAVSFWMSGHRTPSAETCLAIERMTRGQVKVEQVRPDIDWSPLRKPRPS